jgi:hypothetical protein
MVLLDLINLLKRGAIPNKIYGEIYENAKNPDKPQLP